MPARVALQTAAPSPRLMAPVPVTAPLLGHKLCPHPSDSACHAPAPLQPASGTEQQHAARRSSKQAASRSAAAQAPPAQAGPAATGRPGAGPAAGASAGAALLAPGVVDCWQLADTGSALLQLLRSAGVHTHARQLQPLVQVGVALLGRRLAAHPEEMDRCGRMTVWQYIAGGGVGLPASLGAGA